MREVVDAQRQRCCLSDYEVLELARWGCIIEEHYSERAGKVTPMDIEWAKDGHTGELFILQARPETVHSTNHQTYLETYRLTGEHGDALVSGIAVGEKISQGRVHVLEDPEQLADFQAGDVLVTSMTDPAWEPIMKKAVLSSAAIGALLAVSAYLAGCAQERATGGPGEGGRPGGPRPDRPADRRASGPLRRADPGRPAAARPAGARVPAGGGLGQADRGPAGPQPVHRERVHEAGIPPLPRLGSGRADGRLPSACPGPLSVTVLRA